MIHKPNYPVLNPHWKKAFFPFPVAEQMSVCLHQSCQNWDSLMSGRLVHISQTAAPLEGREDDWGLKRNKKWFKAYLATKYLRT